MNGATSPHPLARAVQPADSGHTFVCYSRRDLDFVMDVASRLREREVPVWLDLWDIGVGEDWDRTIDEALRGCTNFLIVLSPDAVRSDEVRGELRSALNNRKPVVPVLYRPCDIPRQLQNTQYLDVTDSGELSEAVLDDLLATLRGEPVTRGDRWRYWRKPWMPLDWAEGRLRAIGGSAVGAAVLIAGSGLLAEASYAHLLGIRPSFTPAGVLKSGAQFFITLLTVTFWLTIPAAAALLAAVLLRRALGSLLPVSWIAERLRRLLGRPGLLWTAQSGAYVLVLLSLAALADLTPLVHVAFGGSILDARLDGGDADYREVVLQVGWAAIVVAGLEAWRRRLQRKRQYRTHGDAVLSLGLALPLHVVVAAELLLLPIAHGLLKLPSRREYTRAEVTFRDSVPEVELRGRSLLLLELRPAPRYRFYCPQGSTTWDVDEHEIDKLDGRTRAPLTSLLGGFRSLTQESRPRRPEGGALPHEARPARDGQERAGRLEGHARGRGGGGPDPIREHLRAGRERPRGVPLLEHVRAFRRLERLAPPERGDVRGQQARAARGRGRGPRAHPGQQQGASPLRRRGAVRLRDRGPGRARGGRADAHSRSRTGRAHGHGRAPGTGGPGAEEKAKVEKELETTGKAMKGGGGGWLTAA